MAWLIVILVLLPMAVAPWLGADSRDGSGWGAPADIGGPLSQAWSWPHWARWSRGSRAPAPQPHLRG